MYPILPKTNGPVVAGEGRVAVPETFAVAYNGFDPLCTRAYFARTGSREAAEPVWITLGKETMEAEAYRLQVTSDGVTVAAATETGVIWALTTLFQLGMADGTVPVCTLSDAPKHGHRGLSFDCVRHFFPVDAVKNVIEQLALVKMNVLHWHLTDAEGWRVESKVFPKLHETSDQYYTQEQIRDIVDFAGERGVEIIPEIDMPGHSTAFLAAYPHLSCTGEEVHIGTPSTLILCAGKESTYEFLEKLLEEVCDLFPCNRFHIGGDEAVKSAWRNCPHCRKRMEEEGLENLEELQGWFTVRVQKMLRSHGKEMVCWNDVLKAKTRPQQMLPQYWTLQHAESMMEYYLTGGKFIYSEMFELYLDYPHSMNSLKKVYSCNPHIYNVDCTEAPGLVGLEACLWSEHIPTPEKLYKRLFPRCQALAENAWSRERDYEDFKARLKPILAYAQAQGITGVEESGWDPTGEEKIEDAIQYLKGMFGLVASATSGEAAGMLEEMGLSMDVIIQMMSLFFEQDEIPRVMAELKAMFTNG